MIESAGRRLAIPFADFWRPTAANYWGRVKKAHGLAIGREILGDRWARDHADDKKPALAAALETAFDPARNAACIGLDQAARDAPRRGCRPAWPMPTADGAMPGIRNPATPTHIGGDPDDAEPVDVDIASPTCRPSSPKTSRPASRSTAPPPDAHFRNGDRASAGARSPPFRAPAPQPKTTGRTTMTDTTEMPSATPAEDIRAHNKNLIFAALAEAGIHRVTVDYDGSGDSGQIESIEAWEREK